MIDFKSFQQDHDLDPISCGCSKVGTVMPEGERGMYYCVVDGIEPRDSYYCEIEDVECTFILPNAFKSIGEKPEQEKEQEFGYSAQVASRLAGGRRESRRERGGRLTLELPEE